MNKLYELWVSWQPVDQPKGRAWALCYPGRVYGKLSTSWWVRKDSLAGLVSCSALQTCTIGWEEPARDATYNPGHPEHHPNSGQYLGPFDINGSGISVERWDIEQYSISHSFLVPSIVGDCGFVPPFVGAQPKK